jgi:hypothetical protein
MSEVVKFLLKMLLGEVIADLFKAAKSKFFKKGKRQCAETTTNQVPHGKPSSEIEKDSSPKK